MAWIRTIPPEEAEGELADLYAGLGKARGGIARVHQVASLHPRAIQAHLEIYKAVMFARSSLSRIERERIAVVVSAANRCSYCISHHREALLQLKDDPGTAGALARGEDPEGASSREFALYRWARTAALAPADSGEAGVESLREAGFDDRAILDATLTVAYFCFVNRLVLLLGVHLEEDFEKTCGALGD